MDRPEVFKSVWQDWKRSPATKALVVDLLNKREHLKEGLAEGQCDNNRSFEQVVGQCQALKDVITYIVEEFDVVDDKSSLGEEKE